ncbi:MAG: PTS sugar transporter subunit IIA [Candidatus Hydrogenedentes bacterium]|nr:PTS sugar transporter subunit IIA [Candidatus Hydrogenedentota bacterium]MBI3117938.1 PTS sugar transporter subunit IIA [Candidatus Hydrogenedentota bacterium]
MDLSVGEVAHLFQVTTDTIFRWIAEDGLPATRFDDRYHFNRVKLVEWAHENRRPISIDDEEEVPSLVEALTRGGVYTDVEGGAKREVLQAVVARMPLEPHVNRDFLLEMLLAREKQGSTGFGGGVAIPHARNPILLHIDEPLVMLAYLKKPVDFDAIDHQPVSVVFSMITSTAFEHLQLLAKLGRILQDDLFRILLKRRAPQAELFARIRELEQDPSATPQAV